METEGWGRNRKEEEMRLALAMIVVAAVLAACGSQPQTQAATPASMPLVPCDDGGSGGVMIDGVCL
jgi:uncharacterized lipoprotein YajG